MATVTAEQMKTQKPDASQLQSAFTQRRQETQNFTDSTINNATNSNVQNIKTTGAKNEEAQNEVQTLGNQAYDFANADLNTQYNRTQQGMDQFADVRGLNRQQGSQQALQLGRANASATGGISAARDIAAKSWARQQQQMKDSTANQIRQAIANGEYEKAAASLTNYNNWTAYTDNRAALLAGMGDYSGIEGIYGPEAASFMQKLDAANNPEVAYNTGKITAAEYERMTGKKPPNYVAPSSGGGYYGGYGYAPTNNGKDENPVTQDNWTRYPDYLYGASNAGVSRSAAGSQTAGSKNYGGSGDVQRKK